MRKIILLTLSIYLLVAPITYHPDTKLVLYYASLDNHRVWNIYKYLNENLDSAPKFHYPPVNYWLVKAELPLAELIGGNNIDKWLDVGSNVAFADKNIFLYNLAVKSPILLLILASGFILFSVAQKSGLSVKKSKLVTLIWYLNPITIYSGVMMGQNDILAILPFLVGFLYFFEKPYLAFVFFGLGSSVKSFPLIWSLALAGIYPTKNMLKKVVLGSIPLFIYGLTILPFLRYDYFKIDVLNSGLAMMMFEQSFDIGHIRVPVVPVLLVIVTLISIFKKVGETYRGVATVLITINLAVLCFSNFNPQWFIWLMPFWSLLLVDKLGLKMFGLMLFSLFWSILLINDKFLYWGILAPINPNLLNLPSLAEIVPATNIPKLLLQLVFIYWTYRCVTYKK